MSNRVYDVLKWVGLIVLPALSTLIAVVFAIWGLPYGHEISETITAIATFLGAIMVVGNVHYKRTSGNEEV